METEPAKPPLYAHSSDRSGTFYHPFPVAGKAIFQLGRNDPLAPCDGLGGVPGRFVKRGELVGYVLDRSAVTARVVVSQSDVDLVRRRTQRVQARFPERIAESLPALLRREVPAATDQLPGKALSQEGGGEIAIDPRDTLGIKAFQKVFLFDVELPTWKGMLNVGGRIYVRFDHGKEPLVWRLYRGLRQLFLRRFNV